MIRGTRAAAGVVGALVALALIAWAVGASLDPAINITTVTTIHKPPDAVWDAVTDYDAIGAWHPEFTRAEMLTPTRWRGVFKDGFEATYEVTSFEFGRRVEASQVERDREFWTQFSFELEPVEQGTRVTIRSHVEIEPPFTRLLARIGARPGEAIEKIAASLKRYVEGL